MAGTRQGFLIGVALLGMVALTSMATAETVPLPTPAPLPKEGVPPKPAAQSGGGLIGDIKDLFKNLNKQPEVPAAPATTTAFNPTQRAQVDKISAYLTSVQQLVGNFVQVGPDGSRVKGEFYIQNATAGSPRRISIRCRRHRCVFSSPSASTSCGRPT